MKSQKIVNAVLGLPVNHEGKYLLTLRNEPDRAQTHNRWQIIGGELEYGETPIQTLSREMQEEAGVFINVLHDHPIVRTNTWDFDGHGRHIILLTYVVDIGDQEVNLNHEATDYQWFTPAEVLDLSVLPNTPEIVFAIDEIVKKYHLTEHLR